MANFPSAYTESLVDIHKEFQGSGNEAIESATIALGAEEGASYSVYAGLTDYYAGSIAIMATQKHIREYCPNDSTENRFANSQSTQQWLQKDGGRAVFLLLKDFEKDHRLVGYGWTGSSVTDEVPGSETTFAVRIGEEAQGKGFAISFSKIIIAASAKLFNAKNYWLETQESNTPALTTYKRLGFEEVNYQPLPYIKNRPKKQAMLGRRIFMRLPEAANSAPIIDSA